MVIMIVVAFLAGIGLFVLALRVARKLKTEQLLALRRKTTSVHIARVVSAVNEKLDEAEAGAEAAESGDGAQAEPDGGAEGADTAAESDEQAEPDDEYEQAGEPDDGYEQAGEYADEEAGEPADDYDGETADGVEAGGAPEEDGDDETRETQAVSMSDIMASCNEDNRAASVKPAGKIQAMQPLPPLRTLLASDGDAGGSQKSGANIRKRRLPETVKMKERKVLMAEDVKVHRELIEMFFEGSGVKFEFAENGRDACEMFEENPDKYSLILMDIHMPLMDGYDTAKKIRSMDIDWAKQIPIVAMTADTTEDDINKCFEAGMDDHVIKPIDMAILQDKVFEFITRDMD